MGTVRKPEPVRLIVGVLAARPELLTHAAERLSELFGPLEGSSRPVPFTQTDYYQAELGNQPWRQFLSFAKLIDPGDLPDIKLLTNRIEQEWAVDGRRPLNLDPGYISLAKLVLASTKNHWHRIYVGKGIYAETTLPYRGGAFAPQEWTYPDYRTEEHLEFFQATRDRYRAQLRGR